MLGCRARSGHLTPSDNSPRRDPSGMEQESPDFRATVRRDGNVRLVDWGPWLAAGGPLYTLLEARARAGVAIADLSIIRDHEGEGVAVELIVDFRGGAERAHC